MKKCSLFSRTARKDTKVPTGYSINTPIPGKVLSITTLQPSKNRSYRNVTMNYVT